MTKKQYLKRFRNIFFASVNTDINKWFQTNVHNYPILDFFSPDYNDVYFCIDRYTIGKSYLKIKNDKKKLIETICVYKFFIFPLDFKVYWYVRKLKKHFKNIEKEKINNELNKNLRESLESIEANFIKEIRKEKLKELEK